MIDTKINIVLLGSTGSIGRQTLDVISSFPHKFNVIGLSCRKDCEAFRHQVKQYQPKYVHTTGYAGYSENSRACSPEEMASDPATDIVVIATTGKAGLLPAITALRAGKTVALANKEILVMAGQIITDLASTHGAKLLPIDSEHSAIWQCLHGEDSPIQRLILTASGGPFFGVPHDELADITPEDALNHPTWKMGPKVTIDSATLFNKGLEVIEAHWLFNIPYDKIEIIVHRQSLVHSMVEFSDGFIKASLSTTDMRLPIQYALFYPQRVFNKSLARLKFSDIKSMTFDHVDYRSFPCLELALEAGKQGGNSPAALCAADEIAVELFLQKEIKFTDIENIIAGTVTRHTHIADPSLDDIISTDEWARTTALELARKEGTCY
jgi:1-deoxy-D-xylulose-5-phosphate reductoisomerase